MNITVQGVSSSDFEARKIVSKTFIEIQNSTKSNDFSFIKNKYLENDSDNIEAIYSENLINLHLSLNDIFSGFTKGHKSSLKKEYPELKYEIFDHTNYKEKQILEILNVNLMIWSESMEKMRLSPSTIYSVPPSVTPFALSR